MSSATSFSISSIDFLFCPRIVCDDVNENYCVTIMKSSVVIVIELWCRGPAALMKSIKRKSLLLKAEALAVKRVG
jgi:hypothetical protein